MHKGVCTEGTIKVAPLLFLKNGLHISGAELEGRALAQKRTFLKNGLHISDTELEGRALAQKSLTWVIMTSVNPGHFLLHLSSIFTS